MSDVNFCENVTFVISGMSLGFVANAQLLLLRLKNHAGTVPDFARQSTRLCPANYPTLLGKLPHFAGQCKCGDSPRARREQARYDAGILL